MGSMMAGAGPPNPASTAVSSAMVVNAFWGARTIQLLHDRRSPQHLQQGRHGQQEHTPGLQSKYFNFPVGEVGGEEGVGHDAGGRGCSSTTQVRPARTQLITQVAGIATLGGIRPRAQRGHTPLRAIGKGTQEICAPYRALGTEPHTRDSDHGRWTNPSDHSAKQ